MLCAVRQVPVAPFLFTRKLARSIADNPLVDENPATSKAGPRGVVKMATGDYRMWYEVAPAGNVSDGKYATSPNGRVWTKQSVVIAHGAAGLWDEDEASPTSVLLDGGQLVMYYHSHLNAPSVRKIGRATSSDGGLTWTKYASNPVLQGAVAPSWEDSMLADAKVLKVGATYHMLYRGGVGSASALGHATSSDGIAWTKDGANPVIDDPAVAWGEGLTVRNITAAGFWHDGVRFHAIYTAQDTGGAFIGLGYTYSADSTTWTHPAGSPVLRINPVSGSEDDAGVGDTIEIYQDGDLLRVLYGGFRGSPDNATICEATVHLV